MIDQCGTLANQALARAMEQLKILLAGALYRDEPHGWPERCLEDRFGICRIVLRSLDKGLYEAGVDQPYFAAGSDKQTSPMMGTGAGFHCNRRWREILYRFDELCAADLSRDYHAICINPVQVERSLSEIDRQELQWHAPLL